MFKKLFVHMLLTSLPLGGFDTSRAQSIASQTQPATVTIYRDLVRFAIPVAQELRIEIFNQKQEKVFDSQFVSGAALDWFSHDQQGQVVDSGLYSYILSMRKESGETLEAQRGNVILDRERQSLTDAPPIKSRHKKGGIAPQTAGVFDVNAAGGSYNINTPLMGIGTAEPLARLHVGADAKEPLTAGATLLIEDGSQSAMVMRSTSGAEMFLIQNADGGVIGTASNSPLTIRTSNLDRLMIDANGNLGIGTAAPGAKLHVYGNGLFSGNLTVSGTLSANLPGGSTNYIQNTGSQQTNTNFNISGNGTLGGALAASLVNATTQYNIGGQRVLSVGGTSNLFAGIGAGSSNTTGVNNSFFGKSAGFANSTGTGNSFFGTSAGYANSTWSGNSFFGITAGVSNSTGGANSFYGTAAGNANTIGVGNSFFGNEAGISNTTANGNSFFGNRVGNANTTGASNSFFGAFAGNLNSTGSENFFAGHSAANANTTGSRNLIMGTGAGASNTTENENTFLGYSANGAAGVTNATTIGARALVTQSNSLVLGSISGVNNATANTNVGIGTTAPADRLDVNGIIRVSTLSSAGSTQLCRNALNQISTCSSSLRYKDQIRPFHFGLALINRLRPVSFNWIEGGERDLGLVAEEVAEVEPLLVTTNDKGQIEGIKL